MVAFLSGCCFYELELAKRNDRVNDGDYSTPSCPGERKKCVEGCGEQEDGCVERWAGKIGQDKMCGKLDHIILIIVSCLIIYHV